MCSNLFWNLLYMHNFNRTKFSFFTEDETGNAHLNLRTVLIRTIAAWVCRGNRFMYHNCPAVCCIKKITISDYFTTLKPALFWMHIVARFNRIIYQSRLMPNVIIQKTRLICRVCYDVFAQVRPCVHICFATLWRMWYVLLSCQISYFLKRYKCVQEVCSTMK